MSDQFFRVLAFVFVRDPFIFVCDVFSAVLISRRERGGASHFLYELLARRGIVPYKSSQ